MSQIISTIKAEVYDSNNVRTGWLEEEKTLTYKNAVRGYMTIDKATADKSIDLINTQIEYLAIYSSAAIKIRVNDITNPQIDINGQFVLDGSEITELYITNPDADNSITIDIVQGDELV